MSIQLKAVKGTADMLPDDSARWQYVERSLLDTAERYSFKEIRTPVFEPTELFNRSVGDTTDVVQKEMYTFLDNGGRSLSLRPEGTAGAVRAFLEHGLHNRPMPLKVSYVTSCYRYEKPQAGRMREFHQFGVECFGAASPAADTEVISLAASALGRLGVTRLALEINSIGCPDCRKRFQAALRKYFEGAKDRLCPTCIDRLSRNPMRILDCKSPVCHAIAADAPVVLDYICDDCRTHFEGVKAGLDALGIEYTVNPHIVRGLDYYTRTVFEFVSTDIGAQGTVCGGGRYDGLVAQMGGPDTPALGFAMGLERLMLVMQATGCELPQSQPCTIYIAPMGDAAALRAATLTAGLRQEGFRAEYDIVGRGLKAQMKYADKLGARYTMVIGDNELESGRAMLKTMATGQQREVELERLADALYDSAICELADSIENTL